MTAPEENASAVKEATEGEGQTRREHLQMLAAGAGVAAAGAVGSSTVGGQLLDDDIWGYDEPLTVSPSLLVETRAVSLDVTSQEFEPSDLDVRAWGEENEVLLAVDGEFPHGAAKPSLVLDRETARQLAHRLLETSQWLAEFQEGL